MRQDISSRHAVNIASRGAVTCFSGLPPASRAIWAKSGEPPHGLLAHMLDVAAVAESLLELEPDGSRNWAAQQLGLPEEHLIRWVAAIVGLHDFGKAIPGFQLKWPHGMDADRERGLEFPPHACTVTDHSCATAALLGAELSGLVGAEARWLQHVIQAISAHHGFHYPLERVARSRPKGEPRGWKEARRALLSAYWQVLAPQGLPAQDEVALPAVNWLAGLTSAADWIASNPDWFPLGERRNGLAAYYVHARELAASALKEIRWTPRHALLDQPAGTAELLARILGGDGVEPRCLQRVGDRLLAEAKGPSLLLVEAPMGEGKTELAFLAHLRLQAANDHRGLYLALPTQATGNALFKRAATFLQAFASGPIDLQLVHSGALLNEDAQQLSTVHLRGINQDRDEAIAASAWLSQRRRPLLSAYGVGTVDQALFAVLNVKHHFVRLWGLGNRVVVLDEVHAYDTYTSGLIDVLLRWLKAMRCSVVLMSATLPRSRRDELLSSWGADPGDVPDLSYPRLLLADDRGVSGEHFPARRMPPVRLKPQGEGLDDLAAKAESLLEQGGCGAVIVNTVDRAQELYRILQERVGSETMLFLFHARFPMDERAAREKAVLASFGARGVRPQQALMISTQVAEQSLDLDFDFMLSDLAPMDLLLQRSGRLHRHDRERPAGHSDPYLWVAGLGPAFPDLEATAWRFVYDAYILGRTWALLQQEKILHLPEDIDRLVQAVYGDEPLPEGLDAQVREAIEIEAYGEYLAKVSQERQESRNVAIDLMDEPQSAYANKPRGNEEDDLLGLSNVTRKGRDTVTLVPVELHADGWRIGETVFLPDEPVDDALARCLYGRQLRLSRRAVVRHFQELEVPAAFAEHPLLRNFHPLPLVNGVYEGEGMQLELDPDLGLVYGDTNSVGGNA